MNLTDAIALANSINDRLLNTPYEYALDDAIIDADRNLDEMRPYPEYADRIAFCESHPTFLTDLNADAERLLDSPITSDSCIDDLTRLLDALLEIDNHFTPDELAH